MPGIGDSRIRELEEKLKQVTDLISSGRNDSIHQLIGQTIDDLRYPNNTFGCTLYSCFSFTQPAVLSGLRSLSLMDA